jgi:hypothetical protein
MYDELQEELDDGTQAALALALSSCSALAKTSWLLGTFGGKGETPWYYERPWFRPASEDRQSCLTPQSCSETSSISIIHACRAAVWESRHNILAHRQFW